MTRIDVVMATRDGGAHLAAQLDSIIAQSHQDWLLIARDDGSSDHSAEMLEQYRRRHPNRITTLSDADGPLGWVQNFGRAIGHSDGAYTALCDQDDVWLPHRLATSIAALRDLERRVGTSTPALVFSDLVVVDSNLELLADSFWEHAKLDPRRALDLGSLISRNVATGNTMIFNSALRELVLPIPECVDFHDEWIATLACAAGATAFVTEPLVLYRQHSGNASGAKRPARATPAAIIDFVRDRAVRRAARQRRHAWVDELRERTATKIAPVDMAVLDAYLGLPDLNVMRRVVSARRHGLLPPGAMRSTAFIFETRAGRRPNRRGARLRTSSRSADRAQGAVSRSRLVE